MKGERNMQLIVLLLLLSALGGKGDLAKSVAPVLNLLGDGKVFGDVNSQACDSFDKNLLGNLSGDKNSLGGLGANGVGDGLIEKLLSSALGGAFDGAFDGAGNSSGGLNGLGVAGDIIKTLTATSSIKPEKDCAGGEKSGASNKKEYPLQDVKGIADQKILCALSNYVALGC